MQSKDFRTGALYIRVSTDKQEELSPDAQKRLLLDYAKNNKTHYSKNDVKHLACQKILNTRMIIYSL